MKISTRGRYAIAAAMELGKQYQLDEYISVISISEGLDISKIYLEQVFSLLKNGNVVISVKGSKGGYRLTRRPEEITVYDILVSIESSLFEETKETVTKKAPDFEKAMQQLAFEPLDTSIKTTLNSIDIKSLLEEADKYKDDNNYMFYI